MSRERAEMEHARAPEAPESKADKMLTGSTATPAENKKRPIRRVKSPSAPRAWLSRSYKPKFGRYFYKPRFPGDNNTFHKAAFRGQNHHYLKQQVYIHRKDYPPPKPCLLAVKEKEKKGEKVKLNEKKRERERYEPRESHGGGLPLKQNTSRPVLPRSTPSTEKDMQITIFQKERTQSRERDHRASKSNDKERRRDGELPLTAIQTAARDRAIQQKRRDIDEVYYQECEMFALVAKMLIAKDPSLEHPIQASLQENLRDNGKRCVEAMEKFIEDYDSRDPLH